MKKNGNLRILITGATGFIGRHLVRSLSAKKNHLIIIGRKDYNSLPLEFRQNEYIEYIQHDLLYSDEKNTKHIEEIDAVINLATIMPDKITPHDDFSLVYQNILQTINLINMLKNISPLKIFVLGSTIDVYPILSSPIDETVLPEPISNYASSKLSCEFICKTEIKKWNKTRLCILRFSQIYGPGDTHCKAIPQFIHNALSSEPIVIHGDGRDVRSFLYVKDAVRAIELAIESCAEGIFNVAGNISYSIRDVAEVINRFSPLPTTIIFTNRKRPYSSSIISIKRAQEALKFYPQYTIEKGIQETIKNEHLSNIS